MPVADDGGQPTDRSGDHRGAGRLRLDGDQAERLVVGRYGDQGRGRAPPGQLGLRNGRDEPDDLVDDLGLGDVVRFVPPVDQAELAEWCRAATLVAVPSYNESFGLVAAEAQATGTPVVAAAVGGLTTVVRDGRSGLLVDTHEPRDWAAALRRIIGDSGFRDELSAGALEQARLFSWDLTAERTLEVYRRAVDVMRNEVTVGG